MDASQDSAVEIFPIRGSKFTNGMKDFRAMPENFEPILEQIEERNEETDADPKGISAPDSVAYSKDITDEDVNIDPLEAVARMQREHPNLLASPANPVSAEKVSPKANLDPSTPTSSTSTKTGSPTPSAETLQTPTSSFPVAAKLQGVNKPAVSAPPAL